MKIDTTSFFSAEGGPVWIKFRRLVQNDMSTAVIWSKSKPDVEFQYGGRLGEFHGMSPRVTCHIAGCSHMAKSMSWLCHIAECNNSIHHIETRFSPYFFLFLKMQFGLWRAAAFVSSPIHLLWWAFDNKIACIYTVVKKTRQLWRTITTTQFSRF